MERGRGETGEVLDGPLGSNNNAWPPRRKGGRSQERLKVGDAGSYPGEPIRKNRHKFHGK